MPRRVQFQERNFSTPPRPIYIIHNSFLLKCLFFLNKDVESILIKDLDLNKAIKSKKRFGFLRIEFLLFLEDTNMFIKF
jgi:hypothetical protein